MQETIPAHFPVLYEPHEFPLHFPVLPSYDRTVTQKELKYLHFHNCFEIGFCFSETGLIYLETDSLSFQPNEFTIIPPFIPHITINSLDDSHWDFIYFDPTVLYAASTRQSLRCTNIFISLRRHHCRSPPKAILFYTRFCVLCLPNFTADSLCMTVPHPRLYTSCSQN